MTRKPQWVILALAILQWHCIQQYVSPYRSPVTGYLVVEGYITGNGPTWFRLTRTIPLPGDSTIPAVTGASLQIEGSDNTIYPFTEYGNGYYLLPFISMNTASRYRLRITNVNKETYLSDFVPYKPTPPIDSVNWINGTGGITIYANTHDPTGNTRYYQWKYLETWELNASQISYLLWRHDSLLPRPDSDQIFTCWHTDSAGAVLIATTKQLAQDNVYEQPLIYIPANTAPLGIEYTVLVSQYALTDSAFTYLSILKNNTDQTGSYFDPLPSQQTGNIHCLSNPTEPVIGYISAGTLQQQRIWISHDQVPAWIYYYGCPVIDTQFTPQQAVFNFDYGGYTPLTQDNGPGGGILSNVNGCIDCRVRGGTGTSNHKPAFWP